MTGYQSVMIVPMNNEACRWIENGNYKKAIQLLRKGNQILVHAMEKAHQEHQQQQHDDQQRQTCEDGDLTSSPFRNNTILLFDCVGNSRMYDAHYYDDDDAAHQDDPPRSRGTTTKRQTSSQQSPVRDCRNTIHDDEHVFVYRHPVRIHRLPTERENYIISVIILFNLGLACQLLSRNVVDVGGSNDDATSSSSSSSSSITSMRKKIRLKLVRESLHFYQLAFFMKNRGRLHLDTTFVLAMVNNTSHIQSELGRESKAESLRELILSTLIMLAFDQQNGRRSATIDELDGFLMTASHQCIRASSSNKKKKNTSSAAAAAAVRGAAAAATTATTSASTTAVVA